jgi:nucleoside phosphorylase
MAEDGTLDKMVQRFGGTRVRAILAEAERLYEVVPDYDPVEPKIETMSSKEIALLVESIDVLVLTTTPVERKAVLSAMVPLPGRASIVSGALGQATYRFGQLGRYFAVHVESTMGSVAREAAQLTVADAIHEIRPKAIIVVGIAFGMSRVRQSLGDVLGAESIWPYELMKVKESVRTPRGVPIQSGPILAERFRTHSKSWSFPRVHGAVDYLPGPVLSGEKLLDNKIFRDSLLTTCATAIGGEMEGAGAYGAASRYKVEIILVKGICDWADGHKNDRAQPFAACAAVDLVRHVLSVDGVLEQLGANDRGPAPRMHTG